MNNIVSIKRNESGYLAAAVQSPVPVIESRADIDLRLQELVKIIRETSEEYPDVELIVFPEYSLQGLNTKKWLTEEFLCDIPGRETEILGEACREAGIFGVFSIMERNPDPTKNPYNSAVVIDPSGEIRLHYRKLFPWNPIEPWYPGDLGMPVCEGPQGSRLAVFIDGIVPELVREAADAGCNVFIRISGFSTQINDRYITTNRPMSKQNSLYTVTVNKEGHGSNFNYFGGGEALTAGAVLA